MLGLACVIGVTGGLIEGWAGVSVEHNYCMNRDDRVLSPCRSGLPKIQTKGRR